MIEQVPVGPTRYRDVVLTSWDRSLSHNYVLNGQGDDCQTLMIEQVPVGRTRYRDMVLGTDA